MKETAKKNSNRLYFNYGSIDSFTNGLKKDDLVVLGADPVNKTVALTNNFIREVVEQDKQVLYVSLRKTKEELLKEHPELFNENILIDDECSTVTNIEKKAATHQNIDMIVIENLNEAWSNSYLSKTNMCYRYKRLAVNVKVLVLVLSNLHKLMITGADPFLTGIQYCNYMFFLSTPALQQYQEDYNYRADDLFNEMEIKMSNPKTETKSKAYVLYSQETYEIREISGRIRKLLRLARSLGLNAEDSIRYAFYWEDKELPEDRTGNIDKGEQGNDQCWI